MMEEESWTLMLRVFSQCSALAIVLILDQDGKGNPIFPKLETPKALSKDQQFNAKNIPYMLNDKKIV